MSIICDIIELFKPILVQYSVYTNLMQNHVFLLCCKYLYFHIFGIFLKKRRFYNRSCTENTSPIKHTPETFYSWKVQSLARWVSFLFLIFNLFHLTWKINIAFKKTQIDSLGFKKESVCGTSLKEQSFIKWTNALFRENDPYASPACLCRCVFTLYIERPKCCRWVNQNKKPKPSDWSLSLLF